MKCTGLTIIIIFAILAFAWMEFKNKSGRIESGQYIQGTNLKLAGSSGPLKIYADLSASNGFHDYAIFDGNKCIISVEQTASNTIVTTHFEQGLQILRTERDVNGTVLKRTVTYHDDSSHLKYTYVDTHGEGLWDDFLDFKDSKYYIRSNLCWVLRN